MPGVAYYKVYFLKTFHRRKRKERTTVFTCKTISLKKCINIYCFKKNCFVVLVFSLLHSFGVLSLR